jgi:GPH family glycoside/pentoside/hexuronide:cation symporter
MPVVGWLADHTTSRWGRFRPFVLWGIVPYGVTSWAVFTHPLATTQHSLVYAAVTVGTMAVVYCTANVPYSAMLGVISDDSEDRNSLSSYRFTCAAIGGVVVSGLTLPLVDHCGGGDAARGFSITMGLLAVLSAGLLAWTFWGTRERVGPPPHQKPSWREDWRNLFANGPWVVLFIATVFGQMTVAIRQASIVYYFKYCHGVASATTAFALVGTLAAVAGAVAAPWLLRRAGKQRVFIVARVTAGLVLAGFFPVDPANLPLLHGLNVVGSLAMGVAPVVIWAMLAEVADFGEWRHGRRTTALVFAAAMVGGRLGSALGRALTGWLLDEVGFVAQATQTPEAQLGIQLLFSLVPAVAALLSAAAVWFYPLTVPAMAQVSRDLRRRRAGGIEAKIAGV